MFVHKEIHVIWSPVLDSVLKAAQGYSGQEDYYYRAKMYTL